MNYLLDTDICVFLIRRAPGPLSKRIASHSPSEFAVSQISVAELQFGAENSSDPQLNRDLMRDFLLPLTVLDFDNGAAASYGPVRKLLQSAGTPIGSLDMLIAAHAISRNLILLTKNLKEFKRVRGLKAEDWTRG